MKKLTELKDLRGVRVIVRASLNVPVTDGKVTNSYRIIRALPTLRYLHEHGAKTIIVGHIGREPEETLKPIHDELDTYLPVQWGGTIASPRFIEHWDVLPDGHFLLAENVRQDEREKNNDDAWAKEISALADVYVNDAFANCHREHMSMVGLPRYLPAYAGLNVSEEVEQLSRVMQPESPSLFLLGGAKFETKLPLIEKYLDKYDYLFVAGALMNDILKAKGYEVGVSLVSDIDISHAPFLNHEKLLFPVDVVVDGPNGRLVKKIDAIAPDEAIMDAGPDTVEMLKPYITEAKTILWNGPFGNFEAGFGDSTRATVKLLSASDAFSVVGGGDTVAAIDELGLNDTLGFVSTGGGAMLTLLENGTTPALEALH
jgi:3-phosphoglycerate kinase